MNTKEARCLAFLRDFFPNENWLVKYKHPEIRNPLTDRPLELDLYCPALKLAIEYNGPQHYLPHHYNGDGDSLPEQVFRDDYKEQRCKELNIIFIEIPNLDRGDFSLEDFLSKNLYSLGFTKTEPKPISVKEPGKEPKKETVDRFRSRDKKCRICREMLSLDNFATDNNNVSGKKNTCKGCDNARRRGHLPAAFIKMAQMLDDDELDGLEEVVAQLILYKKQRYSAHFFSPLSKEIVLSTLERHLLLKRLNSSFTCLPEKDGYTITFTFQPSKSFQKEVSSLLS